jgi:uncharacterized integral membrane protein
MSIMVANSLKLPDGTVGVHYDEALSATDGTPPYRWEPQPLSNGLELDQHGRIKGTPAVAGTARFEAAVTDHDGSTQSAEFSITINGDPRGPLGGIRIGSMTTWLAVLALVLPVLGYATIAAYELTSPGARWAHLAAGTLVSLAAFLSGCLLGFMLATPRVVSSGQLKAAGVSLGSNLAEISDWLTKLLLGAGLVQLTHLGGPISSLIGHAAIGLQNPGPGGAATAGAKVMAGLIILGYAVFGLLEGYLVTSVWYPRKLVALAGAINQLPQGGSRLHAS